MVLSSQNSEFTFLRNVFRLAGVRMHHAGSLCQAACLLRTTKSTVLLADVVFEGGTWLSALDLLRDTHSLVTMLVVADRSFPCDVFPYGACGIVRKPFEFKVVGRLIRIGHEASLERRALQEENPACGCSIGSRE